MWVAATIFFPNVDHTRSTWLEKSAKNKPNLTPDLQALVSKRRDLRDQEWYGRSVPSYSKSVKMGPHIQTQTLQKSHGGWRNQNFGGKGHGRHAMVTAMAWADPSPAPAGRLGDSKNSLLRTPRVFGGAEGIEPWTGVGKCPILGILDITKNSSHYRPYT